MHPKGCVFEPFGGSSGIFVTIFGCLTNHLWCRWCNIFEPRKVVTPAAPHVNGSNTNLNSSNMNLKWFKYGKMVHI